MDLINFKPSLEKSDDFEPTLSQFCWHDDLLVSNWNIKFDFDQSKNLELWVSDPLTSIYNQRVMRVKSLDHTPPEFPFSYEINTVVPAITFSINESHLNLSPNWMFFFEQIRKRIYR